MKYACIFFIYWSCLSVIAFICTLYDKAAAKKGKQRISERTLLTIAVLGGAFAMLVTMKTIRHKTLHPKFMIGLPVMLGIHILLIGIFLYKFF